MTLPWWDWSLAGRVLAYPAWSPGLNPQLCKHQDTHVIPKLRKQREQDQCVLGHPGFHETLSRVLHSLCSILTTLRLEHGFAGELSQGEAALSGVELSPQCSWNRGCHVRRESLIEGSTLGSPSPPFSWFLLGSGTESSRRCRGTKGNCRRSRQSNLFARMLLNSRWALLPVTLLAYQNIASY